MKDKSLSLPEQNQRDIRRLEVSTSVLASKVDNLGMTLTRIEGRTLVDMSKDIKEFSGSLQKLNTAVFKAISELKVSDATQKPTQDLVKKIIEYIFAAGLGVLLGGKILK